MVFATGATRGPSILASSARSCQSQLMSWSAKRRRNDRLRDQARDGIGDNRRAVDYYRLIDGGKRLLWGGRITTRAASTSGHVQELRREMTNTYPQLSGLRTELAWSVSWPMPAPHAPYRRDAAWWWHCTAFGVTASTHHGDRRQGGCRGDPRQSDRHRLFSPLPDWAGGVAGLAVAQLTYWKLQAQDWWRERAA